MEGLPYPPEKEDFTEGGLSQLENTVASFVMLVLLLFSILVQGQTCPNIPSLHSDPINPWHHGSQTSALKLNSVCTCGKCRLKYQQVLLSEASVAPPCKSGRYLKCTSYLKQLGGKCDCTWDGYEWCQFQRCQEMFSHSYMKVTRTGTVARSRKCIGALGYVPQGTMRSAAYVHDPDRQQGLPSTGTLSPQALRDYKHLFGVQFSDNPQKPEGSHLLLDHSITDWWKKALSQSLPKPIHRAGFRPNGATGFVRVRIGERDLADQIGLPTEWASVTWLALVQSLFQTQGHWIEQTAPNVLLKPSEENSYVSDLDNMPVGTSDKIRLYT